MKKYLSIILIATALFFPHDVQASHQHYPYQGGHYASGRGSSHTGGNYKNARTGNHYTHHK